MPPGLSLMVPHRNSSESILSQDSIDVILPELTPSFNLPVSINSLSSISSKTGIPYDDFFSLLENKLSFDDFFIKYPISLFYDETDQSFIENNPEKKEKLNGWIREDFEEFITTIRKETIVEEILPNGQKLINPIISGPGVQFHIKGLTFEHIKYILHHTKEAQIRIPNIPQIDHVVYLVYDYINTLKINDIDILINGIQSLKQTIQRDKQSIIDFILIILESKQKKQTIYKLLTNIRNNQTIYRLDLINDLTTDKLITEIQLILNFNIQAVKPIEIYSTTKNLIESQKDIFQKYQFNLVDWNPETFLVEVLFKKPLFDGIPFLKNTFFLANIFILFENLSTNDLDIYRCKIKTSYSDIIEIFYTKNPDKTIDPVEIKIKVIKNPLSLDVYQNYPQIIQTYYCFYLLNNPLFIYQIYQLLQPNKKQRPTTLGKKSNIKGILHRYQVNGSGRLDNIIKAQAIDKEVRMKELSTHFTTMINNFQDKHIGIFLEAYVNHLRLSGEKGKLYCIYNKTYECIKNRFISGGKKKVSKHKKTVKKHERS